MSDRKKIGVRVDADLWEEFVNQVESAKGQKRGVLGDELENAIRHYIHFGTDKPLPDLMAEFNERLGRVEDSLGTVPADGGAVPSNAEPHTHAPDEKPAANTSTDKKLAYLEECVLDSEVPNSREIKSIPNDAIRGVVKDEYGFRRDTARRYVEQLIDRLGLEPHPTADGILVSQAERERIVTEQTTDDINEITDS